ncbi:MAG: hypothetical protein H5T41_09965 [Methanomassiliicoccales archaeon]|nr:hypothetical protein [Methanomassiliicoccales archaeon]
MALSKRDWILLILKMMPLDRIRLMKALFLLWNRSGRNIPGYFEFVPYLYGPCSFEVYSVLADMSRQGLIVQPPHPTRQWAKYYLTERGKVAAEEAMRTVDLNTQALLKQVVQEVSQLGFYELLRRVYDEAPEFAVNSIIGGLFKQ